MKSTFQLFLAIFLNFVMIFNNVLNVHSLKIRLKFAVKCVYGPAKYVKNK